MNPKISSSGLAGQSARKANGNSTLVGVVQALSRLITLVFIATLGWAVYQAAVNKNPIPTWTWLGMLVLFTVAVGLGVMVLVYRGVDKETDPFDFRASAHTPGHHMDDSIRVEAQGATSLRAEIKMMAGLLQVLGTGTQAMEAEVSYDVADWKPPVVDYSVSADGRGDLHMEQISTRRPAMKQGRCEWRIRMNRDLPTDLNVKFGAGAADLDLSGLTLRGLQVESGVGKLSLDLSADLQRDLEVFVKSGIGDVSLRLPTNTGVRLRSTVGFGSLNSNGLTWDGEFYTNGMLGRTAATLDITVQGGMGKITFL